MEAFQALMEINRRILCGQELSGREKDNAVSLFLGNIRDREAIRQYKKRMRVQPDTDCIYPLYYLPPCPDNKKLRLVQGFLPKTHLLYANHYELEILRLLSLFAPENEKVKEMVAATTERLSHTCFGHACTQGECMATGICVLRFLAAAQPREASWMSQLVGPLGEAFLSFGPGQAANRQGLPLSYLLMAFTDVNSEQTRGFLIQRQDWLLELLRRGWITGRLSNGKISEGDQFNLLGKHIIRNALGTLPGFEDIGKHEIYVSEQDGRCYCDI